MVPLPVAPSPPSPWTALSSLTRLTIHRRPSWKAPGSSPPDGRGRRPGPSICRAARPPRGPRRREGHCQAACSCIADMPLPAPPCLRFARSTGPSISRDRGGDISLWTVDQPTEARGTGGYRPGLTTRRFETAVSALESLVLPVSRGWPTYLLSPGRGALPAAGCPPGREQPRAHSTSTLAEVGGGRFRRRLLEGLRQGRQRPAGPGR